ncbi:MAG: hypothetical protein JXR37_01000 [Kiritimatiellae bacterium]|nr:hypothetical protein [Kiritimatiellia bacterium]
MRAGFGQADITPEHEVLMPGYFTERRSTGVLRPLLARAAVLEDGARRAALITVELIGVPLALVRRIRASLAFDGYVAVTASHTHTGPAVQPIFGMPVDESYMAGRLLPGIRNAFDAALADLGPAELAAGEAQEHGLAFCRRFWTSDGRIVTNPPVGAPGIAGPETEPDHTVTVIGNRRAGRAAGLIVHASNHCDSTGGTRIGPDWTGFMADAICEQLGYELPVLFLPGTQGDINHFNPAGPKVSSPDVAQALGRAYAKLALAALEKAAPLGEGRLVARSLARRYPRRHVSEATVLWAGNVVAAVAPANGGTLNSEDLAKGHSQADLFFARQALALRELEKREPDLEVEVGLIGVDGVRILFLPFETFTQTGRDIAAGCEGRVLVASLSNGALGYLAPRECYARGGYETRVGSHSPLGESGADRLKEHVREVMLSGEC